ncbi:MULTISPECIES: DUF3019 domain-containing protein [Shewanella]|uniref:DUF3019 domain-containing protein n=1 Tax=Shewanella xiamenensis TaxID=332186 RepID=A0AAE4Q2A3_9GAMM|nr:MULTISPECIES: DUF3019 domain-containing protein [Shewanella]MCH7423747.1 DUF3019 domain-containing protein [Shewanella sp. MM_2022_3]MCT8869799.1 DUF3019 domain-containing protein [Shewanella xiamenensis]MDV5391324.1 DUF3019 domain-containing protein [Shewanella xiamenensis]NSM23486.1 DUF3019 domain-containing protein [Shewanella sp. ZOR0012]
MLCIFGLSVSLMGPTHALAAPNEESKLKLTPEICITGDENQACEIRVDLQWQLAKNELVCILSDNNAYPKWCSESLEQHEITLNVSTLNDIHFVLVSKDTNQTLAGAKLKITSTSQPQVRRRYRNPWSLF